MPAHCERDDDNGGGDDDGVGLGLVGKSLSVVLEPVQLLHHQSFLISLVELNKYNHSAQAGRLRSEKI